MIASVETRRKISESNKGRICSQETRNKIRDALKGGIRKRGRDSPNYGRKASESERANMSFAQSNDRHRLYGKHQSEETKQRISEGESIPIVQLDFYGNIIQRWKSLYEASKLGFCDSKISNCCRNKRISHGGCIWMYKKDYDKLDSYKILEKCTKTREIKNKYAPIKIIQLTEDMEFVKEWNSISEVQKYGFNKGCVSNCCVGRAKTHQNYIWIYKIDYIKKEERNNE